MGRFEVTFRTKAAVDRYLADPELKLCDVVMQFEYRGVRLIMVRVFLATPPTFLTKLSPPS